MGTKPVMKWTTLVLAGLTLCGCQNSSPRPIGGGPLGGVGQNKGAPQTNGLATTGTGDQLPMTDPYRTGPAVQRPPAQIPYGQTGQPYGTPGGTTIPNPNPGFTTQPGTSQLGPAGSSSLDLSAPPNTSSYQTGSRIGTTYPPATHIPVSTTQPVYTGTGSSLSTTRPTDHSPPPVMPPGSGSTMPNRPASVPIAGDPIVVGEPPAPRYTPQSGLGGLPPTFGTPTTGPDLVPPAPARAPIYP